MLLVLFMSICKFILLNSSLIQTTLHETNLQFKILFSILDVFIWCESLLNFNLKLNSVPDNINMNIEFEA